MQGIQKYASQILKTPDNNGVGGQQYNKKREKEEIKLKGLCNIFFLVL